MIKFRTGVVRPIALACVFISAGFLLRMVLGMGMDVKLPLLAGSVINFALAAFGAFFVFPKVIKEPFGDVGLPEYLRRLGFFLPPAAWKHVALGVILAACTLGGMLAGSILTGRYVLDWSTISLSHTVFALNPGVWEEFFFRGVIMIVLVRYTQSLRKAVCIQIILFGVTHIKGLDLWSFVDVVSVMIIAVAFVYAAHKTGTLVCGIVFHFLHDALLFVVQVPDGEYSGLTEQAMFYLSLWIMVGIACLVIKIAAEKLEVHAETELYRTETCG